jgi:hypothetical protein
MSTPDLSRRGGEAAQAAPLDTAIDRVAARMVAVPDDPDMTLRIVGALPERSSRRGWLIPQLAALGALAVAAVLWSMRGQPAGPTVLPSAGIAPVAAFPRVTPREPGTLVRTHISEPPEPPPPSEPSRIDFERALPAIELSVIGTEALPAFEALTLAPIEIGELPLTAEPMSPNQFE